VIRLGELIVIALLSALMGFAAGQVIARRGAAKAAPADIKTKPSPIRRTIPMRPAAPYRGYEI
jgi:hypothetical protein